MRVSILELVGIMKLLGAQARWNVSCIYGFHIWDFLCTLARYFKRSVEEGKIETLFAHISKDKGDGDNRNQKRSVIEFPQYANVAKHGDLIDNQSCNNPCMHVRPHSAIALIPRDINFQCLH